MQEKAGANCAGLFVLVAVSAHHPSRLCAGSVSATRESPCRLIARRPGASLITRRSTPYNPLMYEESMRQALALAERGRYSVSPNPMVGCVILRDGVVIGQGFHERAGEPHAEVVALRSCASAHGATMVVSLEPCAHHGRTPPCTDAILAAGIAKVVIATSDPHTPAAGGTAKLQAAGLEVVTGVLEAEAKLLNEKFLWSATTKRPFVLLKAGITLDGKLATRSGDARWITSPESREVGLALREEYDAILVGGGTVFSDDPKLTRRLGWSSSIQRWKRVVLDRSRVAPAKAQVFDDGGETIHITDDVGLEALLADLHARHGITSLIVEGGSSIHSQFLATGLWQKMLLFVAPMVVGGANAPALFAGQGVQRLTEAHRFRFDRLAMSGSDLMITAYPR